MSRSPVYGALLFAMSIVVAAAEDPPGVAKLSWLSGCWEGGTGGRVVEEQWMAPRGGMMLGMGHTVAGERTIEFEQMSIREEGGRLVFTAKPSGQAEGSFVSTDLTPTRVVFENAEHDFPQRVIYALGDDGSLRARIEGKRNGEVKGIDYPMRRAACPGGAAH